MGFDIWNFNLSKNFHQIKSPLEALWGWTFTRLSNYGESETQRIGSVSEIEQTFRQSIDILDLEIKVQVFEYILTQRIGEIKFHGAPFFCIPEMRSQDKTVCLSRFYLQIEIPPVIVQIEIVYVVIDGISPDLW